MPFKQTNEKLSKTEKEKQFKEQYKKMIAGLQRRGTVVTKKNALELLLDADDNDLIHL